ncbi:MAG: 4'-phosphopantetheinyl transferase superfamily protein [Pseudomonadota bacterium]
MRDPIDVYVWPLDVPPARRQSLAAHLSDCERARLSDATLSAVQEEVVIGRGIMREVVGLYLGCAPDAVALTRGPHGKPELADTTPALHFNLSHSGGMAALAVSREAPVGVDIEAARPVTDQLMRAAMTDEERCALEGLSAGAQQDGVFCRWVCKEAALKGVGNGLAGGWREMTVEAGAGPSLIASARIVAGSPHGDDHPPWRFAAMDLPAGFYGAVAAQSDAPLAVRQRMLTPNVTCDPSLLTR